MVLVSGWNAISNQELPRIPHRTRKSDDEIIIINISGCRFMCWKSTLEVRPLPWGLSGCNVQMNTYFQKHPDSLLGSHERDFFFDEDAEEYFFDRDPEIFRHILSFFRTGMFFFSNTIFNKFYIHIILGKLHYPRTECIGLVEEELVFFGISPDIINDCCYEDYREVSITGLQTYLGSIHRMGHRQHPTPSWGPQPNPDQI